MGCGALVAASLSLSSILSEGASSEGLSIGSDGVPAAMSDAFAAVLAAVTCMAQAPGSMHHHVAKNTQILQRCLQRGS